MSIKYEILTIRNAKGEGGEQPYVQLHQEPPMTADALAAAIQVSCSVTRADVKAVMAALRDYATRQLSAGCRFYLPEIGYLSLSARLLKCSPSHEAKVTGKNVAVSGINFRPEAGFLKSVQRRATFARSKFTSSSLDYTEDALWKKMDAYLASHRCLACSDLCREFGLSRYKARRWLGHFLETGKLLKGGTPKRPLYFAAK